MSLESIAIAQEKNSSHSVNSGGLRLECRKIRKPKIEKLRRARINSSLESLKEILLKNTISIPQGARPTKLEKADILEMTVRYIKLLHENLQNSLPINCHQQQRVSSSTPQMNFKQQRKLLSDIANKINSHRPYHHHQPQKYRQHSVYDDELLSATSPPQAERANSVEKLDKENFTANDEVMVVVGVKQESMMKKYHWRPW